jgi:sugar phosphate isomerase/epimerase
MDLTRREWLALGLGAAALGPLPCPGRAAPEETRPRLGVVIHSYGIRRSRPPAGEPRFDDPAAFLDYCAALEAGGVQTRIGTGDAAALARLRDKVEKQRLYLEGIVGLPRDQDDVARFEADLRAAKAAGAAVVRTVVSNERRYEKFETAEAFQEFVRRGWRSLTLAEPVAARHDVRLAVENHKDWRVDELLDLLKRLDSKHVGVCLDTGNSIALLEDPMQVVEAYAPWAFTTHFKDMGVAEYEDGFLLSEVPLGDGFLDLPRVVAVLRRARPEVRFNLEMITRDPLRVPCLTPKYWATFDKLPGRQLAEALARVRKHKFPRPLPVVSTLGRDEQLRVEDENVRRCFRYARDKLQL